MNTAYAISIGNDARDRETFTHFDTGSGSAVNQHLVQDGPSWAHVEVDAFGRQWIAAQRERAKVKGPLPDGGTTRSEQLWQQAPAPGGRESGPMDVMGRDRVTGKSRLVHHEDSVALTSQEHGGRRPGAPGADNNCVVHVRNSVTR